MRACYLNAINSDRVCVINEWHVHVGFFRAAFERIRASGINVLVERTLAFAHLRSNPVSSQVSNMQESGILPRTGQTVPTLGTGIGAPIVVEIAAHERHCAPASSQVDPILGEFIVRAGPCA